MKALFFSALILTLSAGAAQARTYTCQPTQRDPGAALLLQNQKLIVGLPEQPGAVALLNASPIQGAVKLQAPKNYGCLQGAHQLYLNSYTTGELKISANAFAGGSPITVEQKIDNDNDGSDCTDHVIYTCY